MWVELETPDGIRAFGCPENERIWDGAAAHGIALPAICHQGRCLTCAGRLLEGRVEHDRPDQYFPEDAAAGYVLLCCALPRSAVRIRTHEEWEMRKFRLSKGLPAPCETPLRLLPCVPRWEQEGTAKVVFVWDARGATLADMESLPRIREATPSELFAERLEHEAQRAFRNNPAQAAEYRRQAEMLREMAALNVSARATFFPGTPTVH